MNRYESNASTDAAARNAAAGLGKSMREDRVTRLRAGESGDDSSQASCFRASSLSAVREMVELLRRLMFPGFFDPDPLWDGEIEAHVSRLTSRVAAMLREEVRSVLRYGRRLEHAGESGPELSRMNDDDYANRVVGEFMSRLCEIRRLLGLDVQAAYDGDPAAEHTDEIILCYPGLDAIFTHRVAHELYRLGVPILPRVISEQAHSRTGIDIHPGASIGESFFMDHGSATVIGETSTIGNHVKIYQGVTLGARSFPKDERGRVIRGIRRHPTIGDRVTIYAGAVILGGDTVIGEDCVIAGGVFVTSSVPAGHVVQQTRPELVLKPAHHADSGAGKRAGRKDAEARFVNAPTSEASWLDAGAGI